jgi:hypothetical protein
MSTEIDEVYNRPPLKLTRADIDKLIAHQRYLRDRLERSDKPKEIHKQAERLEVKPILPRPTFKRRI